MIKTLEEALERIKKLEEENKKLLSELEYYRNRNYGGRKKHNEAWMAAYNDFAGKYESGMTISLFCATLIFVTTITLILFSVNLIFDILLSISKRKQPFIFNFFENEWSPKLLTNFIFFFYVL